MFCLKGARHGIVRMSNALQALPSGRRPRPGIGLKLLRDGMDSANLVSMCQNIIKSYVLIIDILLFRIT